MARQKRKKSKRLRKNPSVTELFERGDSAVSSAERSVSRVGNAANRAKSLTSTDLMKYGIGLAAVVAIGGAAWWIGRQRQSSATLRLT